MDFIYLTGGLLILASAIYGYAKEHWSGKTAVLALASGAAFVMAGVQNSTAIALTGSVLFASWMMSVIPERGLARLRDRQSARVERYTRHQLRDLVVVLHARGDVVAFQVAVIDPPGKA